MSATTSFFTVVTPSQPTPSQTNENSQLVGWQSIGQSSGTPVYQSGTCTSTSTLHSEGAFATCCGANCPVFTACSDQSVLVVAETTSTCSSLSTCKTDWIFPAAQTAAPMKTLYCGTGLVGASWYQAMPTPGIAESQVHTTQQGNSQGSSTPWGGIGGGIATFIVLVIIVILFFKCCSSCLGGGRSGGGGGGGGGGSSNRNAADDYWRQRDNDIAERREYDAAMRREADMYNK